MGGCSIGTCSMQIFWCSICCSIHLRDLWRYEKINGLFILPTYITGAITPGFMIVTSMFYTREEQTKRVGYWCEWSTYLCEHLLPNRSSSPHERCCDYLPWFCRFRGASCWGSLISLVLLSQPFISIANRLINSCPGNGAFKRRPHFIDLHFDHVSQAHGYHWSHYPSNSSILLVSALHSLWFDRATNDSLRTRVSHFSGSSSQIILPMRGF